MSKRRALEHQRKSLAEIGEILSSMKTLAYMETRKLERFLHAETGLIESIETAAADFLQFEPELIPRPGEGSTVVMLIGSERGFCGDFNRALVDRLEARRADSAVADARIIAVGRKLHDLLDRDPNVVSRVEGASVAEDVRAVVQSLIRDIDGLQRGERGLELLGIYHDADDVREESLLPPFTAEPGNAPRFANPPLLNLAPAEFLLELVDHFLLAQINHMLNASLMAENERRVAHLERAVRHLNDRSLELSRKSRSLRQEEIIEEIEVILLSAAAFESPD